MLVFPSLPWPDIYRHSLPEYMQLVSPSELRALGGSFHCMKTSQHDDGCLKEVPKVCSETSQETAWVTLLQVSLVSSTMFLGGMYEKLLMQTPPLAQRAMS